MKTTSPATITLAENLIFTMRKKYVIYILLFQLVEIISLFMSAYFEKTSPPASVQCEGWFQGEGWSSLFFNTFLWLCHDWFTFKFYLSYHKIRREASTSTCVLIHPKDDNSLLLLIETKYMNKVAYVGYNCNDSKRVILDRFLSFNQSRLTNGLLICINCSYTI